LKRRVRPPRYGWRSAAAAASVLALLIAWAGGLVPAPIPGVYGVMSLASFLLYRHDKRSAEGGRARTRERTLHLADLLGGWPGGLLAQERLRHKTRKPAFQLVFWVTVATNCAVLAWAFGSAYIAERVM